MSESTDNIGINRDTLWHPDYAAEVAAQRRYLVFACGIAIIFGVTAFACGNPWFSLFAPFILLTLLPVVLRAAKIRGRLDELTEAARHGESKKAELLAVKRQVETYAAQLKDEGGNDYFVSLLPLSEKSALLPQFQAQDKEPEMRLPRQASLYKSEKNGVVGAVEIDGQVYWISEFSDVSDSEKALLRGKPAPS